MDKAAAYPLFINWRVFKELNYIQVKAFIPEWLKTPEKTLVSGLKSQSFWLAEFLQAFVSCSPTNINVSCVAGEQFDTTPPQGVDYPYFIIVAEILLHDCVHEMGMTSLTMAGYYYLEMGTNCR